LRKFTKNAQHNTVPLSQGCSNVYGDVVLAESTWNQSCWCNKPRPFFQR